MIKKPLYAATVVSAVNQRLAFAMKQRVFFQQKLAGTPYCMSIPSAFTVY